MPVYQRTKINAVGYQETPPRLFYVLSMALILLVQVQSRVFTAKCSEPQVGISNEDHWCLIPEGVDPELLMKVLGNPEMAALLTSLAKTMKV